MRPRPGDAPVPSAGRYNRKPKRSRRRVNAVIRDLTAARCGLTDDATRHRLSDIDGDARTAWCSGCQGRVDITKASGYARWQCGPRNRARSEAWRARPGGAAEAAAYTAAWKAANPGHAAAARRADRAQVIEAYGGRCNCPGCHVVHAELLTIDHLNGDGAQHRRNGGRSGYRFYRLLITLGFPGDVQLLCGSCNLAKADRGKCPLAGQEHLRLPSAGDHVTGPGTRDAPVPATFRAQNASSPMARSAMAGHPGWATPAFASPGRGYTRPPGGMTSSHSSSLTGSVNAARTSVTMSFIRMLLRRWSRPAMAPGRSRDEWYRRSRRAPYRAGDRTPCM